MSVVKFPHFRLFPPLLSVFFCLCLYAPAQDESESAAPPSEINPEELVERAKESRQFGDFFIDHPDLEYEIQYSEEWQVWVVEFIEDERVTAIATFSRNGEELLEAEITGRSGTDDEEGEGEPFNLRLFGFTPGGGTMRWISIVVVLLVVFNWRRIVGFRNWDIVALLLLIPFELIVWNHTWLAYCGFFAVAFYYLCRLLWETFKGKPQPDDRIQTSLPRNALIFLLVLIFAWHTENIVINGVDDCGIAATLGARYLIENGELPYGAMRYGHDTYGPAYYAMHVPFVLLFPPMPKSEEGGYRHLNFEELRNLPIERISFAGAKAVAWIFDLLLIAGIIVLGRRYHSLEVGLALAIVYAVLPYNILSLQFSSHLVPAGCMVLALVFYKRPIVSALLLGFGAATLFVPAFLIPLWFSYYRGPARWTFGAAILIIALLALAAVNIGESSTSTFIEKTIVHQEGTGSYGSSPFGFWGQNPSLMPMRRVVTVLFLLFCLAVAFIPRRKSLGQLAALSAAIMIGVQFWKTHAGGYYITWYMPLLILATLIDWTPAENSNHKPPVSSDAH